MKSKTDVPSCARIPRLEIGLGARQGCVLFLRVDA